MSLLPEDQEKKRKLRANIQIVLGNLYLDVLEKGCKNILNGGKFDQAIVSKQVVDFPTLNLAWPEFKDFEGRPDAIQTFKLANTQY
jgi:hypothetical protein